MKTKTIKSCICIVLLFAVIIQSYRLSRCRVGVEATLEVVSEIKEGCAAVSEDVLKKHAAAQFTIRDNTKVTTSINSQLARVIEELKNGSCGAELKKLTRVINRRVK